MRIGTHARGTHAKGGIDNQSLITGFSITYYFRYRKFGLKPRRFTTAFLDL
jgi:hypothetical protein